MNKGVAFLMKKNKIEVIEGVGQAGEGRGGAQGGHRPEGRRIAHGRGQGGHAGRRRPRQGHPADRPGADGDRIWTYREAMAPKTMPNVDRGHRLGRHRHRIRQLLPGPGRGSYGRRSGRPHPAGRGRRGLQGRPEGVREARHEVPHRLQGHQGVQGREGRPGRHRGRRQGRDPGGRGLHRRRRHRRQHRGHRPGGAGREDRPRPHHHRQPLRHQRDGPLRHRRLRRRALAGAQGQPRRHPLPPSTSPATRPRTSTRRSPAAPMPSRRSPRSGSPRQRPRRPSARSRSAASRSR